MGAIRIPKFLWDLKMIPMPEGDSFKALYWCPNGTIEWRGSASIIDGGNAASVHETNTIIDGGGA